MALVTELQQEALSKDGSVADLLRSALVVAHKLSVTELASWVDLELNGYKEGGPEVPTYRLLSGRPMCWNHHVESWVPLNIQGAEYRAVLSKLPMGQSISELEGFKSSGNANGIYQMDYPPGIQSLLKKKGCEFEASLFLTRAQLFGVVDTVRNMVLNWSLELEKAGVIGDQMTFSREEKARAANSVMYQIGSQTVIQHMVNSQVQQGTTGSTQVFQAPEFDMKAVATLVEELRAILPQSGLSPDVQAEVEADLSTIDAQAKSPKPRWPIIKETLRSVRNVLEGAAGGAAGTGLAAFVVKLSQLIGV